MTSTGSFAAVFATLFAAHQVADHWIQTSRQAATKGQRTWAGRRACAAHVATYTATAVVAVLVMAASTGTRIEAWRLAAGLGVSAVSHYWADRRTTLARLAGAVGQAEFFALGSPRPGRDDNPSLGTGAYALDQSWHVGWLFVAALIVG